MADDVTQGGTQADPARQPQAGVQQSPSATPASGTQAEPSGTPGSESLSLEEAKKLRSEHASLRKRLAEYERAQQEAEAAKLSDLERAGKRAETAEAALKAARERIGAGELKMAAQAAGIIDPDIATAMLGAKVEHDAQGEPTNVAELVTQLKKDKPHLFTGGAASQQQPKPAAPAPPSSGGATNPGRQAGNGGLTLEIIQQMKPRERMARINEIEAWHKANRQQQ